MPLSIRRSCLLLIACVLLNAMGPFALAAALPGDASHSPAQPKSGEPVVVTHPIAADVRDVQLQYQIVEPGNYIELKDPAYKEWKSLPMKAAGPEANGRTPFAVTLPADVQKHRRLVRYRIAAKSATNEALLSPEQDPKAPSNHAYFVYDGIPEWKGAIKPKSSDAQRAAVATFPPEVMNSVQAYHLLGKKTSIEAVTWKEQTGSGEYKYTGTLVVDGVVYDHVRYRARGGVWRYATGKNQWKLDLPSGQRLTAKDDFNKPYETSWGKVNLRGIIQLGSYNRRGEQGLYESTGFRLFNLAGVPAPFTHYLQLRIITTAEQAPADQYDGDFWGLYIAIENEDGRFLKAHDLPDGNFYKMEGGTGTLENQGKGQPTDGSDLKEFLQAYNSKPQSAEWWQKNLNLPNYYSYRAIVECIHHYDIAEGKNYNYFNNPKTKQWQVIPWDLDLTWADHMYGNGDEPFNSRVLKIPAFQRDYQNRLREIRDLLFNAEQTGQLIEEYAAVITTPKVGGKTLAEADRRKWDWHPAMAIGGQAGQGTYYQPAGAKDFADMVKQMKEYIDTRSAWIDKTLLTEKDIPATPVIKYTGPAGFGGKSLQFQAEPYKGKEKFVAMKWRIAEITPKDLKLKRPAARQFEITPRWESEELTAFADKASIPPDVTHPGKTYRVRLKVKDAAGRWSHWSAPVEFIVGN